MAETVTPRLFKGLRDLLPEQMAARQKMIQTIQGVYESYGFVPLGTPAFEYLDVLTGSAGTEAQQSIFAVSNPDVKRPEFIGDKAEFIGDKEAMADYEALAKSEALALRFDLTVPLARVVSQYRELPRPFRRYQVAPVWRADKPGPGRFREFTQFDIDSVGVSSEIADTEIIAAMCDTLKALEVGGFLVRFSSRDVLNLLLNFAEIPAKWKGKDDNDQAVELSGSDVFRVLDKLDKIGIEKVRLELMTGYKDDSGTTISGLGLKEFQVDRIEQFLAIQSGDRNEVLSRLTSTFSGVSGSAEKIAVLESISRRLEMLGYGNDQVSLDLSVARGLAYYTGPVFEAILTEAPQYGSVFGGGRYDDLVLRFLGERVPATGASIGVDRLLAALVDTGKVELRKSTAQVMVAVLDKDLTDECLMMAFELRRAGIRTEFYLGDKGVGKQLKNADAQDIPVVLLYGSNEKERGVVTVKRMSVGKSKAQEFDDRNEWLKQRAGQFESNRNELVADLKRLLEATGN